jgi:hypothetical protein
MFIFGIREINLTYSTDSEGKNNILYINFLPERVDLPSTMSFFKNTFIGIILSEITLRTNNYDDVLIFSDLFRELRFTFQR